MLPNADAEEEEKEEEKEEEEGTAAEDISLPRPLSTVLWLCEMGQM
jgi:hypothetical protein